MPSNAAVVAVRRFDICGYHLAHGDRTAYRSKIRLQLRRLGILVDQPAENASPAYPHGGQTRDWRWGRFHRRWALLAALMRPMFVVVPNVLVKPTVAGAAAGTTRRAPPDLQAQDRGDGPGGAARRPDGAARGSPPRWCDHRAAPRSPGAATGAGSDTRTTGSWCQHDHERHCDARQNRTSGYAARFSNGTRTVGQLRRLRIGGIELDVDGVQLRVNGQLVHLPRMEFELLRELMENAGQVRTRRQLLDAVWGAGHVDANKVVRGSRSAPAQANHCGRRIRGLHPYGVVPGIRV